MVTVALLVMAGVVFDLIGFGAYGSDGPAMHAALSRCRHAKVRRFRWLLRLSAALIATLWIWLAVILFRFIVFESVRL